jgi:predicted Zn-dependent protease
VVAGAILLAILAVAALVWFATPGPVAPRVPFAEDQGRRRMEVQEAFRPRKVRPAQNIDEGLQVLFTDLGAALRARDGERVLRHFNTNRMVEELKAQNVLPFGGVRNPQQFAAGMRQGMKQSLANHNSLLAYTSFEIRSVKKLLDHEAVVIVRHRDGSLTSKMRWWVTGRSGTWQVYDFEDLDTGLRVSTIIGVITAGGFNNLGETMRGINGLRDASEALLKEDLDTAERKLKEIADIQLPKQIAAVRFLATAAVQVGRGDFKTALGTLDKAQASHPDMPAVDLLRGVALNGLGQHDKALKHLEAYRDLLGEDDVVCLQLGEALRATGRFPEARTAFRKALDDNPKNADALGGLLRVLGPEDSREDVGRRFAKLDKPREHFPALAEELKERADGPGMEQLVQAMRQIDPQCPGLAYYHFLAAAWNGRTDQAIPRFRAALAGEKDPRKRQNYTEEFLRAMLRGGKPLEAYAAAGDPRQAFRILAAALKGSYQEDTLRELLAAHARKAPDDPLLPFYQGELYVREERYPLADRTFAGGMAHPPDQIALDEFRASRVLARYHTGRGLSAYREIGPKGATFRQLASLYFHDRNDAQLQALLDEHARADPNDVEVLQYRSRMDIRANRVARGITQFKAAWRKEKQAEARERLVSEFLYAMLEVGKPVEAYWAAPDSRYAFQVLAESLLEEEKFKDLGRILDVHRRRYADDPWLPFYTGSRHAEEKAWDKAIVALREAYQKAGADLRPRFRWAYVNALYQRGRVLQAYREVPPRKDTFNQLANQLLADRKAAVLEQLLEAHLPHAKGDPSVFFTMARARLLAKNYAGAANLLHQAYEKQPLDYQKRWYVTQFVGEMAAVGKGFEAYRTAPDTALAFDTLARDLVLSKKIKELESLVEVHGKRFADSPLYLFYRGEAALLHGNGREAERHFAAALAKAPAAQRWQFRNGLYRARIKMGDVLRTYKEFAAEARLFETLAQLCVRENNPGQLEALLGERRKARPEDRSLPSWGLELLWLKKDYEGAYKVLTGPHKELLAGPRYRWKRDDYLVRCLVKLGKTKEAVKEAAALAGKGRVGQVLVLLGHAAAGDVKQVIAAVEKARPGRINLAACYRDPDLGPLLRSEAFKAFRDRFPEPKGPTGRAKHEEDDD